MPAAPPVAASISQLTRRPSATARSIAWSGASVNEATPRPSIVRRRETRVAERAAGRVGEQRRRAQIGGRVARVGRGAIASSSSWVTVT